VVYKDHATHLTDLPIASASEKNLLSAMEHHIVHNNKSDTILPKEESVPSCHDEVAATPKLGHDGLPLVPQPSDDPYDPLNWPVVQKLGILFVICFLGLIGPLNVSAIAPSLLVIAEELKCEVALTTYLVGGPLLAYGVSALFWVAVANTFGVRLVFVVATLIGGLLSIWGAMANNFASLAASRTLATVFMATCETLAPQAIADVFYLKDRAKCLGVYVFFTASSFGIGGLVGAYVSADLGWRWVQWIQVILTLLCSLLVFLFYPETQYTRTSAATHPRKRRAIDYISFHAVSGGGRKKVDRLVFLDQAKPKKTPY
jgi:MFS family permease